MPVGNNKFILNFKNSRPPILNLVQSLINENNKISRDISDYDEHENYIPYSKSLYVNPSSRLWDSGLESPTPGSSPLRGSNSNVAMPKIITLSPIPFTFNEDEEMLDASMTEVDSGVQNASDVFPFIPKTPRSDLSGSSVENLTPSRLSPRLHQMKLSTSPLKHSKESFHRPHMRCKAATTGLRRHQKRFKNSYDPPLPKANVNPFAIYEEDARIGGRATLKRGHEQTQNMSCEYLNNLSSPDDQPTKKLALRDHNTSRFKEEFSVLSCIGDGQFGSVYKCINRLDGCVYAIKKTKIPIAGAGSSLECTAINEVYAHAVLGKHPHIVGYYSSWIENDRIFIQTEYCNGGSLSELLSQFRCDGRHPSEIELSQLLLQLADGLSFIHAHHLVHLDLKPDNVLVQLNDRHLNNLEDSGHGDDLVNDDYSFDVLYKIADFGMVTSATNPSLNEGDCRYLPMEILREKIVDIQKADIFSLSLTIYEAGSGMEMPPNGGTWHEYRCVGVPALKHVSDDFNSLLKAMSSSDALLRPSASEVVRRGILAAPLHTTNLTLSRQLLEQRRENEKLKKQLDDLRNKKSNRLIGRFCFKSRSLL